MESFSRRGYAGPLPLPPGATAAEVRAAMAGHLLSEAELVGRYQRGRN